MSDTYTELETRLMAAYDSSLSTNGIRGERLASRLATIAHIGLTEAGGSRRIGFSQEERQAKDMVKQWMVEAGLHVSEDGAGNVFGRLSGKRDDLPAVMSGSHIDTVPNGGHFDGVLGVLSALEVVEAWKETGYQPWRPFEVVIFTDEEGARFNGGLIGSEAMVGALDVAQMQKRLDIYGATFEEVLQDNGLTLEGLTEAKRDPADIKAFVEVHIEQGKRLEKEDAPVGVVTGIAGPCWLAVTSHGRAGHAGNTPMDDRSDALVAASEFVFRVNALPATVSSSAVATVGKLHVEPNGVNVIPDEVKLYVDIRDIHEETRDELVAKIVATGEEIAASTGVSMTHQETMRVQPVPIPDDLEEKLTASVARQELPVIPLPSGAGHDAMNVGRHLPIAMLFVRSQDGVSHNPEEWSALYDCVQTIHVLKDFLESLADEKDE